MLSWQCFLSGTLKVDKLETQAVKSVTRTSFFLQVHKAKSAPSRRNLKIKTMKTMVVKFWAGETICFCSFKE